MVKRLNAAKDKIRKMQKEDGLKTIENRISDRRNMIQEAQKEIGELENKLNRIYEEAAEAMNLLEEHGVKVDSLGQWEDDRKMIFNGDDLTLTIPYDSSSMICASPSGDSCRLNTDDNIMPIWTNEESAKIISESLANSPYNSIGAN
jgi:predicted RNase H-like nuclease (RuvC/YqgF family)